MNAHVRLVEIGHDSNISLKGLGAIFFPLKFESTPFKYSIQIVPSPTALLISSGPVSNSTGPHNTT